MKPVILSIAALAAALTARADFSYTSTVKSPVGQPA